MRKYYVIPAPICCTWDGIFDFMWNAHRIDGNQMMGCRTFIASTEKVVIKLVTD